VNVNLTGWFSNYIRELKKVKLAAAFLKNKYLFKYCHSDCCKLRNRDAVKANLGNG